MVRMAMTGLALALGLGAAPARAGLPATPTEQWRHPGSVYTPAVLVQLTDDDGDGVLGPCDHADVVVLRESAGTWLTAYDGPTGAVIVDTPLGPNLYAETAAGDLDGDGEVEFAVIIQPGLSIAVELASYDSAGAERWRTILPGTDTQIGYSHVAVADVDEDGTAEILTTWLPWPNRSTAISAQLFVHGAGGGLVWSRQFRGGGSDQTYPLAADLDPSQPGLELLVGGTCFAADGSMLWQASTVLDGAAGIGDLDGDGSPEIAVVEYDRVSVLDALGNALGPPVATSCFSPSPPVVADIDGDGMDEIAMALNTRMEAYDWDGTQLVLKWTVPMSDSSCCAGPIAFDFDGDGAFEVLMRDEAAWFVLEGADGAELHRELMGSGTWFEIPVVGNIDADPNAEVVVTGWQSAGSGTGVWDVDLSETPRAAWNERTYHVTNVEDDGRVPRFQDQAWTLDYGWQAQVAVEQQCCETEVTSALADASICLGEDAMLDASGLGFADCANVEYSWTDDVGTEVGTSAVLVVSPLDDTEYRVVVTCADDATCRLSDRALVAVRVPPQFDAVSVVEPPGCRDGLLVSWPPALFDSGDGVYNVFRSVGPAASCADAVTRPPIAVGLRQLSLFDTATVPGEGHVYVVEAEDAVQPPCETAGADHGGDATRSCFGPVEDEALPPTPEGLDIVLFATHAGDDVRLTWSGARPLLPGEHFHLLEAVGAPVGFQLLNAERSTDREHVDGDLSDPLRFFDVRVANACEAQSDRDFP